MYLYIHQKIDAKRFSYVKRISGLFRFRYLQWLHFIYKQDALSLEFQAQSREDFLDMFARHPRHHKPTVDKSVGLWIMYKRIVSNMSAINYSWNLCLQFKLHFQHGSEKFKGLGGIWWFVHSVQGQKPTNAMRSRDKQVRMSHFFSTFPFG